MSGTIDHEVAAAEVPAEQQDEAAAQQDDGKFFFTLQADDESVTELKFRKNGVKVFSTIMFALDYINQSFDKPFPTLGGFLRNLADSADQIEAQHRANDQAANDQSPVTEDGEPAAN